MGSWHGTLLLDAGYGLYAGPAFITSLHAHHALQVSIGIDRTFRLRADPAARWRTYRGAIILSDQPHQLDGQGHRVALLYLDPESSVARRIAQLDRSGGTFGLPAAALDALLSRLTSSEEAAPPARLCEDLIEILAPERGEPALLDERVISALNLLRAAPERRAALSDVASAVGLSPSRLAHLFRAHTGLPIRRYLLWLRLGDALQQLARGASRTTAAHAAGFADSAHFSRTFRRMLGITPSALR